MRIKIMAGIAALALSSVVAVSSADARGWHHGWHGGGGAIAGFAAGAILGGLAAQGPYGYYYGPDYYYAPDYAYEPDYAYAPGPAYVGGGDVRYCMSRFKSYDPASGTYLGYDGYRHPCP
jgi:BA14K-like protein